MSSKADRTVQIVAYAVLLFVTVVSVIPFVLLIASSFTSEAALVKYGYSFFPKEFSLEAYRYLLQNSGEILRAYGITVLVTVVGTAVSLLITSMLGYGLSRREVPFRGFLTFVVFFTMLFNGGLVPTYLVYTQVFNLKNTLWALIVPGLLMNGFNVLLMRTFFMNSVPEAVIESARIDGAGEFRIFFGIVLPLSLPIIATISLLQVIIYWNDWFNGLVYITDSRLFSIQNLLNRMMSDIQFLSSHNLHTGQFAQVPSTAARMAIAVIAVIPIIAAYPFFQKYLVKGLALGAVKE